MDDINRDSVVYKNTMDEWSRLRDLNPRPADYKSAAIPLSQGGTESV